MQRYRNNAIRSYRYAMPFYMASRMADYTMRKAKGLYGYFNPTTRPQHSSTIRGHWWKPNKRRYRRKRFY